MRLASVKSRHYKMASRQLQIYPSNSEDRGGFNTKPIICNKIDATLPFHKR